MLKTKNDSQVYIDGVSLQKISEMHGTPCYIYSKNSLMNEFEEYKKAFKNKKDILICYSVKACSNLNILKIFNDLGSGFDIVSLGELERLKYIGADPKKIVFSGVAKSDEEIKASLEYGILLFNVESIAELENINSIANKMDTKANISIRVNPDIDPKTHPYISTGLKSSKFGIAIDQAIDVYDYANKMNNVIPIGIDAHIGSQIFDIVPFVDSLDKLMELYSKLKKKNIDIKFIDIGGGLGIKYYDDDDPPSKKEFASKIIDRIKSLDCNLILEPGRSLVGNSGYLLTSVLYEKQNYKKDFLIVDAGMNDLLRPSLYDAFHKIEEVNKNNGPRKKYNVVGPICETGDVLGKDVELPPLVKNDLLIIHSVGAYGYVMSSNYNTRPKAPEVLIEDKKIKLIRKKETITQIMENEFNNE
tara:strand:+ start:1473 stop:2723 length:1251 start_codon:yes stop_codon:yes gene_type:complete